MSNESTLGFITWVIVLILFIGLTIYIIHCFPLHVFIFICTIVVVLLFNEIKYIN